MNYARQSGLNSVGKRSLLWALLVIPMAAFGQGFTRLSLPVPVEIDGQVVRSSLYLKMEMKSYNVPIDTFAEGQLDPAQTMLVTAVKAIREGDSAKFASVWTSPDKMKTSGEAVVALADNTPDNWLKLIRSMFDFQKSITVVAEVLVGSQPMFVWDSATKEGIQRRAFYVGPDKNNRLRLSIVSSATPVHDLVLNAFDSARSNPDSYKPLPDINLRYQYPIPLEGKGNASAHPVFLEFDGTPLDFSLTDEKIKPPTPVLEFLRSAFLAYRSGKNDEFVADFTPKSGEKVKQMLAAIESARAKERQQQLPAAPNVSAGPLSLKAGYVKFVLNAEPIFLVFQAPTAGNGWVPAALSYSYILHQDGTYKIANFGFSNFLDDLLQDPSLFDKRILKPVPQKTGPARAKPAPATAKPAVVKH